MIFKLSAILNPNSNHNPYPKPNYHINFIISIDHLFFPYSSFFFIIIYQNRFNTSILLILFVITILNSYDYGCIFILLFSNLLFLLLCWSAILPFSNISQIEILILNCACKLNHIFFSVYNLLFTLLNVYSFIISLFFFFTFWLTRVINLLLFWTGSIPPELGQLNGLTILNLSNNQLTGTTCTQCCIK